MTLLRKAVAVFVTACLLDIARSTPVNRQQVIGALSNKETLFITQSGVFGTERSVFKSKDGVLNSALKSKHTAEGSVQVNVTFDSVDVTKTSNRTLHSVPFIELEKFQIMNVTSALENGILNATDMDCAESSPNFLVSIPPSKYVTSSFFRTKEDILQSAGVSKYVDIIGFAIKPLRPPPDFDVGMGGVDVFAWEIDNGHPENVYEASMGFFLTEEGSFPVWPIQPREFIPGWGERVNVVEFAGWLANEETTIPWQFCVDDILMEVRERGEEE